MGIFLLDTPIYFYRANGEYGIFSNFHRYGFWEGDVHWRTVEHYFQAQKFLDHDIQCRIQRCFKAGEAAEIGRSRSLPLRPDWEDVKENVMRYAVLQKFSQHKEASALLLSTGNRQLVEHTPKDAYWGDGGNGLGKNRLGHILMKVREELRSRLD